MGRAPPSEPSVDEEAARWFARLNGPAVSTAELDQFRTWRSVPAHDAAFLAVERVWDASARLKEEPEILASLSDARRRQRAVSGRRNRPAPAAVAGLGMAAAGLFAIVLFGLFASAGHTYETAVGERRTVILADGSRVSLDTNSRITVRFTRQERLIDLARGQALFDVVHQTSRILRVKAGETLIQDLGTRFDVRREDDHVRVTVVEGSVKVDTLAGKSARTLVAGQQILTGGDAGAPPYSVDPVKATSWTGGRLIFEDMRLVDATSEINRYGRHPLILRAGPLDDLKVNGTFDSADTQAFVAAVTQLYGLKADPQPDGSILLTGARDASR